ncbi:MAG TPA: class I SAM-dependent methyltransferase [Rhodanobacteraceae bacterium]
MTKTYDRAYFDKWYRDPRHAVASPAEVARKVALAVAVAEYYLGRRIRNVLDVGCGEAHWRAPLLKLRPDVRYRGLDASEYVVTRFGRTRNIGLVRFSALEHLRFDAPFDLILCTNVLHYIGVAEVRRGLAGFDELLAGAAFIEVFTRRDDTEGDDDDYIARSPAWYLRLFRDAGLTPVGSHAYVGTRLGPQLLALESPFA